MADFSSLKQTIQSYIKQNGNEEITGNILQDVLLAMVSTMGDSAINGLASALQDELNARQNADGILQGNITAEATARQQADTALGGRIDGLQNAINGINTKLAEGYIYAGIATPSTNPGTPSGKVFYIAVSSGTYTNFSNLTVAQGINIFKYNGSAWSKDVVYIVDEWPKKNSQNLVTSGGVFDNIGALDVSELNATENPHTLAQYADLSAALAAIPTDYQKGGMSIKFVQSSDNKYVQYRLMAQNFSTTIDEWQGVDDVPTVGSDNLVKSGGVAETTDIFNNHFRKSTNICSDIVEYPNMYIKSDGTFASDPIDRISEMFPIKGGVEYTKNNIRDIAFYDKDKTFISRPTLSATFTTPSNARYARISTYQDPQILWWQINEGDILLPYETPGLFEKNVNAENDDIIEGLKKQVYDSTIEEGGNHAFHIKQGETYIFTNVGTVNINLYAKATASSTNITIGNNIPPSSKVEYTAEQETFIVVLGGSGIPKASIILKDSLLNSVEELEEKNLDVDILNRYGKLLNANYNIVNLEGGKTYAFENIGLSPVAIYGGDSAEITISSELRSGLTTTFKPTNSIEKITLGTSGDSIKIFIYEVGGYYDLTQRNDIKPLYHLTDAYNNVPLHYKRTYKFVNTGNICNLVLKSNGTVIKEWEGMRFGQEEEYVLYDEVDQIVVGQGDGYTRSVVVYDMGGLYGSIKSFDDGAINVPITNFDFLEEIEDVSSDFSEFDFSQADYQTDLMEQLYSKFDELCALYPEYIKKYDPMASSGVSQTVVVNGVSYTITVGSLTAIRTAMVAKGFNDYPEYANGVNSPVTRTLDKGNGETYEVTYEITPAYKTYLYLLDNNDTELFGSKKQKKIFITGGIHANERIAPVNLYIFAKKLCESVDDNAFKLRASANFCIIPFVNGYSCYHTRRGNANWVDICRNFPSLLWIYNTEGLDNRDIWRCTFSGPEAASEFETNLIMSVSEWYGADFVIDHHNYGYSAQQFYDEYVDYILRPTIMKAAIDTSKALKNKYPQYFGNGYKLFLNGNNSIRLGTTSDAGYFNDKGKLYLTIEVSQGINFNNGVYTNPPVETFSNKVANVAYYTFKHQLMLFVDYLYTRFGI